jgi:maltooligosyltrehalose trehalohydrolase
MIPRFGAVPHENGVAFRVWAPAQHEVTLVLDGHGDVEMQPQDDGFFAAHVTGIGAGQRYQYRLRQGLRPDPASRFQPEGPLGPSQVVDLTAFRWNDSHWRGVTEAHRHVTYEMHLGTFTREGTWTAAAAHLPYLAEVGVTTLEIMPIAEFAGDFGWGYDGVNLFAPTRLYGTPEDAQRFVNEAHRLGLAVILDVVYNHLGPVGNFFGEFSHTVQGAPGEWGDSINYDGDGSGPVRDFVIENAAYWVRDFHFDGLRLDATQGIIDTSDEHVVSALCRAARAAAPHRVVFIVGESEPQDVRLLKDSGAYTDGLDAIWNEDWHHAAFVALTGRRHAYFTDYRGDAPEFASMARHGFLYQGQWYSWQQQGRGGYSLGLPGARFVSFLENHDQVANTGLGTRLYQEVQPSQWRAFTALLLLGPSLPLLFQGQEFRSSRPFTYFADHQGELAAAVEEGRLKFLTQFPTLARAEMQRLIPRPHTRDTFTASKLDESERTRDTAFFRLHRDLIRLRRDDEVIRDVGTPAVSIESAAPTMSLLLIRYISSAGHRLLIINTGDDYVSPMNNALLAPVHGERWVLRWSSEHPDYGGVGIVDLKNDGPWILAGRSASLLASEPMA